MESILISFATAVATGLGALVVRAIEKRILRKRKKLID